MRASVRGYDRLLKRELRLNIKKKKEIEIVVDFRESDFKHLCGSQYFEDEIAKLKMLKSEDFYKDAHDQGEFTTKIMGSAKYSNYKDRVMLTGKIKNILYGKYSVYEYKVMPGKRIKADFFLLGKYQGRETYLFIRKRRGEDVYGPVSVFFKNDKLHVSQHYEYNQRPYTTKHKYCIKDSD